MPSLVYRLTTSPHKTAGSDKITTYLPPNIDANKKEFRPYDAKTLSRSKLQVMRSNHEQQNKQIWHLPDHNSAH